MAILDVLTYPDPLLKQVAAPVTEFDSSLARLAEDLEQTMRAGPGGVGIAAPQVGVLLRVVIVDVSSRPGIPNHGRLVLVNPEIQRWKGMVKGREGCLSVPDFIGTVIRAEHITLQAQDIHGGMQQYQMQGYEARAVQHEVDHLDGLLFLDRLVSRHHDLKPRQS